MTPKMKTRFRITLCLSLVIPLCTCVATFIASRQVHAQLASSPNQSTAPLKELRFPVAYLHGGSWCYGFLYGSDDKVRFEVVQPESAKGFSFEIPRAEVIIRQWILLGTPQDAVELKFQGKTYHMRWLASPNEILNGGASRWTAPVALPPYALIAAMQNPAAALAQIGGQPVNSAGNHGTTSGAPPGSAAEASGGFGQPPAASVQPAESPAIADDGTQSLPPGMLAGVYVSTVNSNLRPTNAQYIFYPDGMVMNGVPEEGMLNFDFNHYRIQNNADRNWVGRYQLEGELVKIVWINQLANPSIILRNETVSHSPASTGPQVFFPACRCTGKQFSGVYHWNSAIGNQYIQFFPNGAFIDHGVLDQMISPSRFFDHPRIQSGRYQIARQTIIFTFADGHRAVRTFLAPKVQEGEPRFDWISLGRQMFFEQNYQMQINRGR